MALVSWTETVNLALVKRDLNSMQLRTPAGDIDGFAILQIFPFTSETKRMGIIVRVSFKFDRYQLYLIKAICILPSCCKIDLHVCASDFTRKW